MMRIRPLSNPFFPLRVLDLDRLDDVCDVLAAVERGLEKCVDVLPLDDLDRVRLVREQLGHRLSEDLIAFVLEGVELDPMLLEVLQAFQVSDHLDHLGRRGHQRLRLAYGGGPDRTDLVQLYELARVVRDIGHVVDLRGEPDDVLTVEWRDEGLVELAHDLVGELVAVVLDRVDIADLLLDVAEVREESFERLCGLERVLRVLTELREEDVLAWHQRKAHVVPPFVDTKRPRRWRGPHPCWYRGAPLPGARTPQGPLSDFIRGHCTRWLDRPTGGSYATSRRIEAIAPAAITTPKSTRIPRSRSTTASPMAAPLIITALSASLAYVSGRIAENGRR